METFNWEVIITTSRERELIRIRLMESLEKKLEEALKKLDRITKKLEKEEKGAKPRRKSSKNAT